MLINPTNLLALDEEVIMAITLGGLMFMIPIVAILTHHQRKMAEIIHKKQGEEVVPALMQEIQQLRNEVQSMRTELNANTIAVDDMKGSSLPSESGPELSTRMTEER